MSTVKEPTTNGGKKTGEIASTPQKTAPGTRRAYPLAMMRRYLEEADRMLEDFGLGMRLHFPGPLSRGHELLKRETGMVPAEWSPQVDVVAREGKLMIRADLPGMSKDDIKVEVADDVITIEGERKAEKKEEREGLLYNECRYGKFYRAIPLPEGVDAAKATAEFRNGVLDVTIPLPTQTKPQARRVAIQEKP